MSVTVFPAPSTGGTPKSLTTVFINSTQSWTAPAGVTVIDLLLVGGGGGGGASVGQSSGDCGGGGGGAVVLSTVPVTPGTAYTVTIGAGGAGNTGAFDGAKGGDSTFGSLRTALGGGGGQGRFGVGTQTTAGGCGGGICTTSLSAQGGGGGGFFTVHSAVASVDSLALQGNNGHAAPGGYTISGQGGGSFNRLFGGGGGGGSAGSTITNYGGYNAGRGALRGASFQATAGVANFGGGGGGGSWSNPNYPGANGGSGTAIISYWS